MSQFIYPIFEKKVNIPMETTGEFIAQYINELEELADQLQIQPLSYFDSITHNRELLQVLKNYEGNPEDIIDTIPHKEVWFNPTEGIKTFEIFYNYLREHNDNKLIEGVENVEAILREIEDLMRTLKKASHQKTRFQLKIG